MFSRRPPRHIRDEEDLQRVDAIPVLARIPKGEVALGDAHRDLITEVGVTGAPMRTILVSGASGGEGTTSTAIALAGALTEAGRSVVLADFNVRTPAIGATLGLADAHRLDAAAGHPVETALVAVPGNDLMRVLAPVGVGGMDPVELAALHRLLPRVVAQARELADHVVMDTPPLGRHADALWLTRGTDRLLIALRPGTTERADYRDLRSRLARTRTRPDGAILVGVKR